MEENLFDRLDDGIITYIAHQIGEFACAEFRETCRRMKRAIPPPRKLKLGKLAFAAGESGDYDVCKKVAEKSGDYDVHKKVAGKWNTEYIISQIVSGATVRGHFQLCSRFSRDKEQAFTYGMARGAIIGHRDLSILALATSLKPFGLFGCSRKRPMNMLDLAIKALKCKNNRAYEYIKNIRLEPDNVAQLEFIAAIRSGDCAKVATLIPRTPCPIAFVRHAVKVKNGEMCRLLLNRVAESENVILAASAACGYLEGCLLASEYGANNFHEMMLHAAKKHNREFCELAITLQSKAMQRLPGKLSKANKIDIDDVLGVCASIGNEDLCYFARSNGAKDFDKMLWEAARNKRRGICKLAIEWGAKSDILYAIGVRHNNMSLCIFAHDLGIPPNEMLGTAIAERMPAFGLQAIIWGATDEKAGER